MIDETVPIIYNCPREFDEIELYPLHDIHYGNECFDARRWKALKSEILEKPNRFVVWVGDLMENAIPNSKGDIMAQLHPPQEQFEWVVEQFRDLADRTIGIVSGNHESNRTTKACGLYPLYNAAVMTGLADKFRDIYAVLDIGVGQSLHRPEQQTRYFGYMIHKARDTKYFNSSGIIDGIDFFLYGHDHDAKSHPRAKMVYDNKAKTVVFKNVRVVDNGAFLSFGGYAARNGMPPVANTLYKFVLNGGKKKMKVEEFEL